MEYDRYVVTEDNMVIIYHKGHQVDSQTISGLLHKANYKFVGDV